MTRRAVFLDRDGVINAVTVVDGVSRPPATLDQLDILDGVAEALDVLGRAGYLRLVVTNQPDVARGQQDREVVEAIHRHLSATLPLDGIFVCYHDNSEHCTCRKPKPGLLLQAAAEFEIDLSRSVMVGDRDTDIAAGQAAGCRTVLVGQSIVGRTGNRLTPDFAARDLAEAADMIVHLAD